MNRIIGIIPARFASVRFPGKVLAPLHGRPLIAWVVERVQQASCLAEVYVATDDERVRDAVEAMGGRVVMTRPDHPSGTDRVAEAAERTRSDVVINVQGDEPLIDPVLVDQIGAALDQGETWDMATAATPMRDPVEVASPHAVKVVTDRTGRALYFSRSPIPFDRDRTGRLDADPPMHWRHIGIYGYRTEFLRRMVREAPSQLEEIEKLEQLRALDMGCRMKVIPAEDFGCGVDTPEDLTRVEALVQQIGES